MGGDRQAGRTRLGLRAVSAGLALVLAVLAALAVWSSVAGYRSAIRLERSGAIVEA